MELKHKIRLLTLLLLLLTTSISHGQKLKKKPFNYTYIATPTETKTINKNYVWAVADRNVDNLGKLKFHIAGSKSSDYSKLTGFYGQLLDRIPQFTCKKNWLGCKNKYDIYTINSQGHFVYKDTIRNDSVIGGLISDFSNIKIEVQPLNVVKKMINNKERLTNQPSSLPALSYDFIFTLDRSFVFYENMNKELLRNDDLNRSTTFKYNFPRDYKNKNIIIPTGYATTAELEQNYLKYRIDFMRTIKEAILKNWIKKSLGIIVSKYSESKKTFAINLYYIKDKKERYPELTLAFEKMKQAEVLINGNYKLKNKENWHSPAIQKLVLECEEIWSKVLNNEDEIDGAGKAGRLNEEQYYGIAKNLLWAKFILNQHEEVIKEIEKLRKINNKAIKKLFLSQLFYMAKDYKMRYDINAPKYGWTN